MTYVPSFSTDIHTHQLKSSLSAYLYEATSNETYNLAAEQSAQFIKFQLYNGQVVLDAIDVTSCERQESTDSLLSYNTGFFIEGLSIHSTSNTSWSAQYVSFQYIPVRVVLNKAPGGYNQ